MRNKRDRDVTGLFLDIASYTGRSAQHSRDTMNALVERYFPSFLDSIWNVLGIAVSVCLLTGSRTLSDKVTHTYAARNTLRCPSFSHVKGAPNI